MYLDQDISVSLKARSIVALLVAGSTFQFSSHCNIMPASSGQSLPCVSSNNHAHVEESHSRPHSIVTFSKRQDLSKKKKEYSRECRRNGGVLGPSYLLRREIVRMPSRIPCRRYIIDSWSDRLGNRIRVITTFGAMLRRFACGTNFDQR